MYPPLPLAFSIKLRPSLEQALFSDDDMEIDPAPAKSGRCCSHRALRTLTDPSSFLHSPLRPLTDALTFTAKSAPTAQTAAEKRAAVAKKMSAQGDLKGFFKK